MLRSVSYALAFGCGAMLTLQGCGGGGDGPAPTTVTTTTTIPTGPSGLDWCEYLPAFYKNTYSNGTKSAAGQCLPSTSPGAYFTKQGQKDADGKSDKPWMCFSPDFEHSLWTNEAAQAQNFEGACLFKDYSSTATPGSVKDCSTHLSHHPAVCAPGPSVYWGACWSSHSENWKCIPIGDATIPGVAKGDCKASVLQEPSPSNEPTEYFYDGACRFGQETVKMYKCDTVPDYLPAQGSTCGQRVDAKSDKACFSLESGVQWQCIDADTGFTGPCEWILQPDSKAFYGGACVFPQNKKYKHATDAHNLTAASDQTVIV